MSETEKKKYYAIEMVNKSGIEIVCYAVDIKNARFISESLYQMRGFFAEEFEVVSVNIGDAILPTQIKVAK